jgi:hypothetical protein
VPVIFAEDNMDSGNPWDLSHASTFFDMTRDAIYFKNIDEINYSKLKEEEIIERTSSAKCNLSTSF